MKITFPPKASRTSQERAQGLLGHVQDLRKCLFRALIWVVFTSLVAFVFMSNIVEFLKQPYILFIETYGKNQSFTNNLFSIGVFEVITMNLKICLFTGFTVALPLVLLEFWRFVRPALYPFERRVAGVALVASVGLFYAGLAFGYFTMIPYFFNMSLSWAGDYAQLMITYESYFNALLLLLVVFGGIFEIPVVLSLLGLAGILPSSVLAQHRKIVFLGCFIVGAIVSPPDALSMCLMALPMYAMVELSIFIIRALEKRRKNLAV